MALGSQYSAVIENSSGQITTGNLIQFEDSNLQPLPATNPVTSGDLSTTTVSSGTAKQNPAGYQITLYGVWTADATNNIATLTVALSPDDTTFSTVQVFSLAAAVNTTGAIALPVDVTLPAGWWVKFTSVHGTVGTLTYA